MLDNWKNVSICKDLEDPKYISAITQQLHNLKPNIFVLLQTPHESLAKM